MAGNTGPGNIYRSARYVERSKLVRDAALRDSDARCMAHCTCSALTIALCVCGKACGLTLGQHRRTTRGNAPKWSAGHARPNDAFAPLRPEVLSCNVTEGNERRRNRRDRQPVDRSSVPDWAGLVGERNRRSNDW
jgi:hypothetical protein